MGSSKVLVVDNDLGHQSAVSRFFMDFGLRVKTAADGLAAFEEVMVDKFDLVVSELNLPHMNGIDLLRRIRDVKSSLPVILFSADAGVVQAVEAMKLGAHDFVPKPLTGHMIKVIAAQFFNGSNGGNRGETNDRYAIITRNREMNRLLKEARDIADSQASVLIQGESGTGKELFARYIHRHSNRKDKPFVAINCAALPETLLESELFGHEKGAFTGAVARKKGKFEIASRGTILLDEISEMDLQLQSKLLRVLQEKEIDRVGGTGPIPVDVRVIATTNRDIEEQLKEGRFREDLYYRLNVIPFHLPPLRDRRDDIPLLANYFVEKYNRIDRRSVKGLTEAAIELLVRMPWKGNVRELENSIERAVLMCRGDFIEEKDLLTARKKPMAEDLELPFSAPLSLREVERKLIFQTLNRTNGNRTHAAELLGISVRTLRNKLNEYRRKMEAPEVERHANC